MRTKQFILGAALLIASASRTAYADVYQNEYQRAIQGAVANIQSSGAVVASPSQVAPDYYYNWVRDTSLTMKAIVTLAYAADTSADLKTNLLARIDQWIDWETAMQAQAQQSSYTLGEPRFNLNGTLNTDPWGRPQNDGPALRAQTAMLVANEWVNEGRISDVNAKLYQATANQNTIIKNDLDYVAANWGSQSVDLWEEERGMHFYTLTVQKAALTKGAVLAKRLGDLAGAAYYAGQAAAIDQYLEQFWDASNNTLKYAINVVDQRHQNNLDISILLAAIETYDGKFYVDLTKLNPTVNALISQFQSAFAINQVSKANDGTPLGVSLGRYPGDVYSGYDASGGNPWFLSTLALGEFLCDLNKSQYHTQAINQFNRVLYHMNSDGSLAEQFNKGNGYSQGAHDLTWSYTSYITAYRASF
jgi:glucoamylase